LNKIALTFLLLSFAVRLPAYEDVTVKFNSVPLNIALTRISTEFGMSISFDDRELEKYSVTLSGSFESAQEVLFRMTSNLPLTLKMISGVWVVSSVKSQPETDNIIISGSKVPSVFQGVVLDAATGERLPYSSMVIWGKRFYTDRNGYFNIKNQAVNVTHDSAEVLVSYLGYTAQTATLHSGSINRLFLSPAVYNLSQVYVKQYVVGNSFNTGELPSSIRINHAIAKYLPGNGDNSVFNLLRLMPGVRAVGEPSFLSVWGSVEGESMVKMDGYRLYAMNNFNEQISAVNPFMVKEIRLSKGAFPAHYGGVAGSIAEIVGIDGNTYRPTFKANINNQTANTFASVPVGQRSVLMASYRQTYYDLYDVNTLNPYGKRPQNNGAGPSREMMIVPDYMFRDLNLRWRSSFGKDNSVVAAFYAANDDFNYEFESTDQSYAAKKINRQYALSLNIDVKTVLPGKTDFEVSYSSNNALSDNISRIRGQNILTFQTDNLIGEAGAGLNHKMELFGSNFINFGASYKYLFDNVNDEGKRESVSSIFFNDKYVLDKFEANVGLRMDAFRRKFYFQPRISATYLPVDKVRINAAFGVFNQYSGRIPFIGPDRYFTYIWKLFDGMNIPVVKSVKYTFEVSYNHHGWLLQAGLYNKDSRGILRFNGNRGNVGIHDSRSISRGVDLMLNREFRGSYVFVSSSFSSVKESLLNEGGTMYSYIPYEIKGGILLNLSPFHVSLSYVNGSGYRNPYSGLSAENNQNDDYSRLDLAFNYTYSKRRFLLNAGISVLNLFNTYNYKYIDVIPSFQGTQSGYLNTYSEAIPFTPLVFVEINL
jgi:hypothetical protein